jgi:hypothetical protein
MISREKLFAALYPDLSFSVFSQYLVDIGGSASDNLDDYYASASTTQQVLRFTAADGDELGEPGHYLVAPLRGILSLLLMLSGFASAMYCYREERNGSFVWLSQGKRSLLPILCHLTAILPAALAVYAAMALAGILTAPLRDRFGVIHHLEYYTPEELTTIVTRSANVLGVAIDGKGAGEIARRSRGTPRLANRLLKRCRDIAQVMFDGEITEEVAVKALDFLDVDRMGLDHLDRLILTTMIDKFAGGPVGLSNLAAAIGEDGGTLEDVYEPYLIKNGFLMRTPSGRVVTNLAYTHLGLAAPTSGEE